MRTSEGAAAAAASPLWSETTRKRNMRCKCSKQASKVQRREPRRSRRKSRTSRPKCTVEREANGGTERASTGRDRRAELRPACKQVSRQKSQSSRPKNRKPEQRPEHQAPPSHFLPPFPPFFADSVPNIAAITNSAALLHFVAATTVAAFFLSTFFAPLTPFVFPSPSSFFTPLP